MKIVRDFKGAKINRDLSDRLIASGEYRDLLNGRVLGSSADDVGVIENIRGMLRLNIPQIPSGFEVIGMCCHGDFLYYIATNLDSTSSTQLSNGDGSIIGRYNKVTMVHELVMDDRIQVGEVLSVPGGVTFGSISDTGFTVSWSTVTDATAYDVEYSQLGQDIQTTRITGATTATITGLERGTRYSVRVRAISSSTQGDYSQSYTVLTTGTAITVPPVPTGLTASAQTQTQINISWNASVGATSYLVEYTGNSQTQTMFASTTSVVISGLIEDTEYSIRVSAVNSKGSSSNSPAITVSTLAAPSLSEEISISPDRRHINENGGDFNITLESSLPWTAVTTGRLLADPVPFSGSGQNTYTVRIEVRENTFNEEVSGAITFRNSAGNTAILSLSQDASESNLINP